MIQHMNLVFQAEGLSVGEGAFLMACCNHTDAKGYVIAHMQQIADEAHMSLRSARDQRAKLEKRRLLKAGERFSEERGAARQPVPGQPGLAGQHEACAHRLWAVPRGGTDLQRGA